MQHAYQQTSRLAGRGTTVLAVEEALWHVEGGLYCIRSQRQREVIGEMAALILSKPCGGHKHFLFYLPSACISTSCPMTMVAGRECCCRPVLSIGRSLRFVSKKAYDIAKACRHEATLKVTIIYDVPGKPSTSRLMEETHLLRNVLTEACAQCESCTLQPCDMQQPLPGRPYGKFLFKSVMKGLALDEGMPCTE